MSVRRSLAWTVAGQVAFFTLQFGGSVVLARLLSPYEMGVYALAAAVIGVISTVQAFGLTGLIVREEDLTEATLETIFTVNAALSAFVACVVLILAWLGAPIFHEPGVRRVLTVLALIPLIGTLEFRPSGMFQRESRFSLLATVTTLRMILSTTVTVGLAAAGYSYMSIAWGQLSGCIFGVTLFNLLGRRHVSVRLRLAEWRKVLVFGLRMLAIAGVNTLSVRMADIVFGRLAGLSALGLYSRATNLNNLMWDNVHLTLTKVAFSDLAEQRRRGRSLHDWYLGAAEMLTGVLWPTFIGLAILAGPLVYTVYGAKWAPAAPVLSLLSLAGVIYTSIAMTWELFVVCDETAIQARYEVVRTGVGFAMFCVGALFGMLGAATARVLEALFSSTLYRGHVQRMTSSTWGDFLRVYRQSGLAALAAVSPAGVLMLAYGGSVRTPLWMVMASVVAGVLLWALALRLLKHRLGEEGMRLVGQFRKRRTAAADGLPGFDPST